MRSIFDYSSCADWLRVDRGHYFSVLWICRPVGANSGSNGNDGDPATVVVPSGLYRCANCLERDQGVAGVGDAACWLIEGQETMADCKRRLALSPGLPWSNTTIRHLDSWDLLQHIAVVGLLDDPLHVLQEEELLLRQFFRGFSDRLHVAFVIAI